MPTPTHTNINTPPTSPTQDSRPTPQDLLKSLQLPKDFSTPIQFPDDTATTLDNYEPTCDSLKLKKQLTTLHLQTASLNHASLALTKLIQLTDSKKPEVARRACMSLLKLAHLHNTQSLIPDNDPLFPDDEDETPKEQGSKATEPTVPHGKAPPSPPLNPCTPEPLNPPLPPPFIIHNSAFALPPPRRPILNAPLAVLNSLLLFAFLTLITLKSPSSFTQLSRTPMPFTYEPTFQLAASGGAGATAHDTTQYRQLETPANALTTLPVNNKNTNTNYLHIAPEALRILAREAFNDISFYLRSTHLARLREELEDPEASDNDRFVIYTHLQNAVTASAGLLPTCQDTGTAIVMGKKGQRVLTSTDDAEALSAGIYDTYHEKNLRYSQIAPLSMFNEKNTASNLPAQIDLYADTTAEHADEYSFLFIAKGGGSANKSYLYQQTPALLNESALLHFIQQKLKDIGTSACPPYHLAVVIGGTSAETNLKTVKLASTGYYDALPTTGSRGGRAFRDLDWEKKVYDLCTQSGIGAQFGGKYFAHDVRVIRMTRHAASCPVGIGVSCSADRNIKAKITKDGIFLEQLERHPEKFLPATQPELAPPVTINLDLGMDKVRAILTKFPVKTRLSLNGTIIVARDVAHARIKQLLDAGQPMPQYMKDFPVYYAGPAKTPPGMPSGSFGPTTAGRMDAYVDLFQSHGGSLITLAKGNRSKAVTDACKKHRGFYLGSIGGPAAILAQSHIKKVDLVDFEDLGMEAIRKIEVQNFPAFIVVDDKGNDFFMGLT